MNQITHINSLIFQSLKILKGGRDYMAESEFKRLLNLNDKDYENLLPFLVKNARIEFRENSLRFKPLYNIGNFEELTGYLKEKYLECINFDDIKDSSVAIRETCTSEDEVVYIKTKSSIILSYNNFIFPPAFQEIRNLWHSTNI